MTLVDFNWQPTRRQLRQFAAICCVGLPTLGWLWGGSLPLVGILAGLGLLIAAVGIAWPNAIKPVYLGLMVIATPIGMVLGELAMLLVFLLVFLPIGLALRLLRRDPLQRTINHGATTYWQSKKQPRDVRGYYRQS